MQASPRPLETYEWKSAFLKASLLHSNRACLVEPITCQQSSFGPCGWHFEEPVVTADGEGWWWERSVAAACGRRSRDVQSECVNVSLKRPLMSSSAHTNISFPSAFSSPHAHNAPAHWEGGKSENASWCRAFILCTVSDKHSELHNNYKRVWLYFSPVWLLVRFL